LRGSCITNFVLLVEHDSPNLLLITNRHLSFPQNWYAICIISCFPTNICVAYNIVIKKNFLDTYITEGTVHTYLSMHFRFLVQKTAAYSHLKQISTNLDG